MLGAMELVTGGICAAAGAASGAWATRRSAMRRAKKALATWETWLEEERVAKDHLCFAALESLAYAIEASDPFNAGHLACVQRIAMALGTALKLPEGEREGLRAAALLHNIGRLGVPERILNKAGSLTSEEQEKLRRHPVISARILASVPFPWPVLPAVRHYAEHWDGQGYPDGLSGTTIPLGARVLSVASAYSALLRARPFRPALSAADALAEIERRSGTQFDPAVVTAFRAIAADLRYEAPNVLEPGVLPGPARIGLDEGHEALLDIAAAQRETLALTALAEAVSGSLHIEAIGNTLLECVQSLVECAGGALFLPDEEGECLRALAAVGVNQRHLLGSLARVGTYLTGRAFSRGEMVTASFLPDDLTLRDVSDPWVTMRSTLIVPLLASGKPIGTINLYSVDPEAFSPEDLRVMRLVATQASRAIDNARRFCEVEQTAYTDALTGLRNGRYLREFLLKELNRAGREEQAIAILNIDVDHFKQVNDNFGHSRGDQALRDIAGILNSHIRNYDLAARYAGDEFVVVLARTSRIAAEVVAAKLRIAVDRHAEKLRAREPGFPPIGISIGVALYPDDGQDLQSLLCRSDAAMYADKSARKAGRHAA